MRTEYVLFALAMAISSLKKNLQKRVQSVIQFRPCHLGFAQRTAAATELSEDIDVEFMALPASILQNCLVNVFPY